MVSCLAMSLPRSVILISFVQFGRESSFGSCRHSFSSHFSQSILQMFSRSELMASSKSYIFTGMVNGGVVGVQIYGTGVHCIR